MTTSDIAFSPPPSNTTNSPPAKHDGEAGVAVEDDGEVLATLVPETAAVGYVDCNDLVKAASLAAMVCAKSTGFWLVVCTC